MSVDVALYGINSGWPCKYMFATFIKWAAKMKHAKDLAKQRWREKRVKYTAFSLWVWNSEFGRLYMSQIHLENYIRNYVCAICSMHGHVTLKTNTKKKTKQKIFDENVKTGKGDAKDYYVMSWKNARSQSTVTARMARMARVRQQNKHTVNKWR